MHLERSHAEFGTTRWSLVDRLRSPDQATQALAREQLVERYWPPVYAYLRRSGQGREQAAEITQAFFCGVVLPRSLVENADSSKGKLRSLMLASLRNFLIDESRRDRARSAAVERAMLDRMSGSLDGEEALLAGLGGSSPEATFDRRWALGLVREALRACEAHFAGVGKARHWAAFEARVLHPAVATNDAPPLARVGAELGFASAADAAAAVQVVKKRLLVILEELAMEVGGDSQGADGELRSISASLESR